MRYGERENEKANHAKNPGREKSMCKSSEVENLLF